MGHGALAGVGPVGRHVLLTRREVGDSRSLKGKDGCEADAEDLKAEMFPSPFFVCCAPHVCLLSRLITANVLGASPLHSLTRAATAHSL
jgi:hypothetical protein